ncbi:tautomerase family protein [Massilia niastensis]|uniref:tautomerase family protein n=1 Tax=Massilia niastensis TaxID=544911 RepID=UPI00036416C0|nr:4-oxalocrotonate tautomerase family protein [Massilia niastensis]
MPLVQISIPAGSLDDAKKADMIKRVTDAVVEAEGFPAVRAFTWVHINEVPDGGWGMGGQVVTLDDVAAVLKGS